MSGPNTGPSIPHTPKILIQYEISIGEYISMIVAPPVARTGPPKNPVKNRKIRSISIFTANLVGGCSKTKTNSFQK